MIQTYSLTLTVNYTDGTEEDERYLGFTMQELHDKITEVCAVPTVSSLVAMIAKH